MMREGSLISQRSAPKMPFPTDMVKKKGKVKDKDKG